MVTPGSAAAVPLDAGVVRVVEVVAEAADPRDDPAEVTPLLEAAASGEVHVQLRRTTARVTVGAGLARRPGLLDRVRALPGAPPVAGTSAGGTFVVGGAGWLALSAVGRPPPGRVMPLDWMLSALRAWMSTRLVATGLPCLAAGKVQGAWCPGFSDLGVGGRKLCGLGFRVTHQRVLARGTLAVLRLSGADLALLKSCHAIIGLEVRAEACGSLAEISGEAGWGQNRAVALLRGDNAPA